MKTLLLVAAIAAAAFTMQGPLGAQPPGGFKGKAKAKAGPFKRLPNGKPDMQGYWQTSVFFTAFDLEEHKDATFEVPAGPGVVVDPPNGKIPYQPWALEKKKDMVANHLADDPQAHCWLSGVPRQMYTPFGFQILQSDHAAILNFEAFHAFRLLYLDGKHPDASIKMFEGDSRARWEGDTLVVDVTNLSERTWFDMEANFHGPDLHVVERYTMKDEDTISYEATLTEPKVYTQPWKIAFDLVRNKEEGYETLEYACVEGEQDLSHYTESVGGKAQDKK